MGGQDLFGGPSGGWWPCARDLSKLYKAFLAGFQDQFATESQLQTILPSGRSNHLTSAKIAMDQPSRNKLSYAFGCVERSCPIGWVR